MSGLVTLEYVQAAPGFAGADAGELQSTIDRASSLVRLEGKPYLDDTTTDDCPEAIQAVLVEMCRRGTINPSGNVQETLGDYSRTMGSDSGGVATIYLTRREARIVRNAAGKLSATTLPLEGYLPQQRSEDSVQASPFTDPWDAVNAE